MSTLHPSTPPLPLVDGNTFFVDNSAIEVMTTCSRKAQYTLLNLLRAADEKTALKFGGIMHKVLETRYRAGLPGYAQTNEVQSLMMKCAEEEFFGTPEYVHPLSGLTMPATPGWSPPEDDFRTFSCMTSLIREYGLKYPIEDWQIATFPDGKPFIEVPFAIPLGQVGEINIVYQGKIDLVYRLNGGLYILDHKSSSMKTNGAEFTISHQFKGYEWGVAQMLGEQVVGSVINRVVCRKPTKTGVPFDMERIYNASSAFLLEEWKEDILHIVADFFESAQRGYFPKYTASCSHKFGVCNFHKVCTLDSNEQRAILLNSGEFVKNTWSPLT